MSALDSDVLPDWVADVVDWNRPPGGPFGAIVVDAGDGRLLGVGVNRDPGLMALSLGARVCGRAQPLWS